MRLQKPTKIRSKKITQSAKGEYCTLRIPSICNNDTSTTVFAHLPGYKGTSTKNHDIFGLYACSNCHAWIDGRYPKSLDFHRLDKNREMLRALQETQLELIKKGLIEIKGVKK